MLILAALLIFGIHISDGANILVYSPMFGQSHIRFMGNIADILSRAGHNLTVLSVEIDPLLHPFGTKENNIHKVHVSLGSDVEVFKDFHDNINNVWTNKDMNPFNADDFEVFFKPTLRGYSEMLKNKTLIDSMRNSRFDLAIHEFYEVGSVVLMETFGISKTILASAIGDVAPYTYDATGIPFMPSFVPVWAAIYGDEMSFWQRMDNIIIYRELKQVLNRMENRVMALFRSHYPINRSFQDMLANKTGMIFSNVNEFTQTPRPISTMIQFVGGSSLYPVKPLTKEFDDLLNKRKQNVLFSLGSFVRLCEAPLEIKKLFAEAFSSMEDVTFIVKYENCSNIDFSFDSYDNIVSKTWLPQTDLLGDDRINIFITHGGMNSITEGQYRGKPMITIPIMGDQILNSRNAVRVGSTVMLDRRFITKEQLVENLKALLDPQNPHVKKAKFVKKSLEGREEEYRQKIVKWVTLQAEADKPFDHHVLHSKNLSTIELYNLDILGLILSVSLATLVGIIVLVRFVFAFLRKLSSKEKKE